jgi:hypothetical protein
VRWVLVRQRRSGEVCFRPFRQGKAGWAWFGLVLLGSVWLSKAGTSRLGAVGSRGVWSGVVMQVRWRTDRSVSVGFGRVRQVWLD